MFTVVSFAVCFAFLLGCYGLWGAIAASLERVNRAAVVANRIKARDNGGRYTKPYRRSEIN